MKEKTTKFAGKEFSPAQIKGTLKLLKYYRAFIRSDKEQSKDPEGMWGYGVINKDQAKNRLRFLINVAINRKAGIPDVVGRKQTSDYQRDLWFDCREVRAWRSYRGVPMGLRKGKWRTAEIQKRFKHIWREIGVYDEWFE